MSGLLINDISGHLPVFTHCEYDLPRNESTTTYKWGLPIGPTTHWSYGPLVLRPIGPTAHWSYDPLVLRPIGPTTHWQYGP